MQSSLLRLAVALLAFGLGVSATMFWIAYRTPDWKRLEAAPRHALPQPPPAPPTAFDALPPTQPAPPRVVDTPLPDGIINDYALSKPAPIYPPAAVAYGVSGLVVVRVRVNKGGRVISAEALSGNPLLREAAVDAAYYARFSPALPTTGTGLLSYNFVLP
jgi:TonB family protein